MITINNEKIYMNNARLFLSVIILIFSFQSWAKADDIKSLEIDGFSIGDSLLKYDTKKKIKNIKKNYYPGSDRIVMIKWHNENNTYDELYLSYELNDPKFLIHEIKGIVNFSDANKCISQRNDIVSEIKNSLNESVIKERDYIKDPAQDKSGDSKNFSIVLDIEGGKIRVYCLMWGGKFKEKGFESHLAVIIYDEIFRDFLMNEAYK